MYQFALIKVREIEEKISQLHHFESLLELVMPRPLSKLPLSKDQCPVIQKCVKWEI